ncbi:MAG: VOC family protein [Pyrinomonadaceae bacterium]
MKPKKRLLASSPKNESQPGKPFTHPGRETAGFYQRLGLKIVDSLPRYARFDCPSGDLTLSIQSDDNAVVSNNIVLYFGCDELDAEATGQFARS